jgi:hypothetical protein
LIFQKHYAKIKQIQSHIPHFRINNSRTVTLLVRFITNKYTYFPNSKLFSLFIESAIHSHHQTESFLQIFHKIITLKIIDIDYMQPLLFGFIIYRFNFYCLCSIVRKTFVETFVELLLFCRNLHCIYQWHTSVKFNLGSF